MRVQAVIDRKDREEGRGGAGEIIKGAPSVTHRLLSAKTEEDQTRPTLRDAAWELAPRHAFTHTQRINRE